MIGYYENDDIFYTDDSYSIYLNRYSIEIENFISEANFAAVTTYDPKNVFMNFAEHTIDQFTDSEEARIRMRKS